MRIANDRLASLLTTAAVTREQLYSRPLTADLAGSIRSLQQRFASSPAPACDDIWRRLGPGSSEKLVLR